MVIYLIFLTTLYFVGSNGSNSNGLRSIRSAMVEWSLHVGEPCRQILEGHFSAINSGGNGGDNNVNNNNSNNGRRSNGSGVSGAQSELLVLCDKSLFLLKAETGGLIQQRRLERADASCMCVVPPSLSAAGNGSGSNFILAGHDATIQVYSGFNLGEFVSE